MFGIRVKQKSRPDSPRRQKSDGRRCRWWFCIASFLFLLK